MALRHGLLLHLHKLVINILFHWILVKAQRASYLNAVELILPFTVIIYLQTSQYLISSELINAFPLALVLSLMFETTDRYLFDLAK